MSAIGQGTPFVSVIVPCRNEAAYIGACLDSILQSRYPIDRLELLVADGRSDDGTRAIVERYAARHPQHVRLLDNPERIVPTALNRGIRAARGDVIARMDAHVAYPPEYLPALVTALRETGADNVGGPVVTRPARPGPVTQAIAIALSHPFGVGNSYFRIGGGSDRRWVDTVPFGCWPRAVFDRVGLFDEELVRNQDDEFNHRLLHRGGRVLLEPRARSIYYARASLPQLARMYYQYGYYKPLVARKVGAIMTLRQLVPGVFVAGLLGATALAPFWSPAAWCAGGIAVSYAGLVAACAGLAGRRHGLRCVAALAAAFMVLHVSYGSGFWRGVWDHWVRRRSGGGPLTDPAAIPLSR